MQAEVFSFKHDLSRIESWLISTHGDLRRIADHRLREISKLKQPQPSQPYKVHAEYYKSILQFILHVESLSTNTLVNKDDITSIIHNSSWVSSIVSKLPENILMSFTRLIEKEPRVPPPSGVRYFEIMKGLVDRTWREFTNADRIRGEGNTGATAAPTRVSRTANLTSLVSEHQSESPSVTSKKSKKSKSSANLGQVKLNFQCPMHEAGFKITHDLGHCEGFFKASNATRLDMCRSAKACFSCFKPDCLKLSPPACVTTNLPRDLVCVDCRPLAQRRAKSVLLCTDPSHRRLTTQQVQDALSVYLKSVNVKFIDHLRPYFNLASTSSHNTARLKHTAPPPRSKSSSIKSTQPVPVFDTSSGKRVASPTSVKSESDEDAVYVFQTVRIGSESALIFYDSGASANLVLGSFAERVKFKTISPDCQLIGALGDHSLWTDYGLYSATLGSKSSGKFYNLTFQGISKITSKYPEYDWSSVISDVRATGMLNSNEPLPQSVGGRAADILIGLKTPELQPRLLFTLPSGLGIYRCQLRDVHGSTIAFGGPCSVISKINRQFQRFNVNHMSVFFSRLAASLMQAPWVDPDIDTPPKRLPLVFHPTQHQSTVFDATPLTPDDVSHCVSSEDSVLVIEPPELCSHGDTEDLMQRAPADLVLESPDQGNSCESRVGGSALSDSSLENPDRAQVQCPALHTVSLHPSSDSLLHDEASPSDPVLGGCPPDDSASSCPYHLVLSRCMAHKATIPLSKLKNVMESDYEPIISYRCPICEDCRVARSHRYSSPPA